jgi:uncharacterized protein
MKTEPVMRITHRRAKAGCNAAYEALIMGMFEQMKKMPGFLGAELVPPRAPDSDYQIITKFKTQEDFAAWDTSAERRQWHERVRVVADGDPEYRVLTGLEAWFSLPEMPSGAKPSRSKMALLTWLGIWPTASAFLYFLGPYLEAWPYLARTAVVTGLVVLVMTYLLMPRLTAWLRTWLHQPLTAKS